MNQLINTAAIEVARSRPLAVVAVLHPGTVVTGLTRNYRGSPAAAAAAGAAGNLLRVLAGPNPSQSAGCFDWQGERVPW